MSAPYYWNLGSKRRPKSRRGPPMSAFKPHVIAVPMRGGPPKCADQISKIRKDLAAGKTEKEIAAELGVTQQTISRYVRKYHLVRNRRPSKLRTSQDFINTLYWKPQ